MLNGLVQIGTAFVTRLAVNRFLFVAVVFFLTNEGRVHETKVAGTKSRTVCFGKGRPDKLSSDAADWRKALFIARPAVHPAV